MKLNQISGPPIKQTEAALKNPPEDETCTIFQWKVDEHGLSLIFPAQHCLRPSGAPATQRALERWDLVQLFRSLQ